MALRSRLLAGYQQHVRGQSLHEPKIVSHASYKLQELGLRTAAEAELREIGSKGRTALARSHANWRLAIWTYRNSQEPEEWHKVRNLIDQAERGPLPRHGRDQLALLRVLCWSLEGHISRARHARLWHRLSGGGERSDTLLALSHGATDPEERCRFIAKVFRNHGLQPPSLRPEAENETTTAVFDRLEVNVVDEGLPTIVGPMVSVIMAAYNAEATITTALRALTRQTWTNMEVLVVDDCSTDGTREVVERLSQRDPRIRLLRMARNLGAYVARNHALSECSGHYVTLHDSDDWSHPRKIEIQAMHLENNPHVIACTSQRARANEQLRFTRLNRKGWLIGMNNSSLMFRKQEIVALLGEWDSVRIGADTELIRRIHAVVGKAAISHLHTGPVCLQRLRDDSAVGNVATGFDGFEYGVRHLYAMAYRNAHGRGIGLVRGNLTNHKPGELRAPAIIEAERRVRQHYDVIIAADFRIKRPAFDTMVSEIKIQLEAGLQTALISLYHYEANPSDSEVDLLAKTLPLEQLRFICYGESASCDTLLLRDPSALETKHDLLPEIKATRVNVIVDTLPWGDGKDKHRFNSTVCQEHLLEWLGQSGVWYTEGPWMRQRLQEECNVTGHAIQLAAEPWIPIRSGQGDKQRRPEAWIDNRQAPWRIGMFWHDESHKCIRKHSSHAMLHLLGLDRQALPAGINIHPNWILVPNRNDLGSFIYRYLDAVWEPTPINELEVGYQEIVNTMASGVPMLLDPSFQPLFGDAACYCTVENMAEILEQLCNQRNDYVEQVGKASQHINKNWGAAMHLQRLGKWTGGD